MTKNSTPMARINDPIDEIRFQKLMLKKPSPARAAVVWYMRRGWPWRPMMCIGPNVMLSPTTIVQKLALPHFSLSCLPNIFGHQ